MFKTTNLLEGRQPVNRGRGLGKGWLGGLRAFMMLSVVDKDGDMKVAIMVLHHLDDD